MKVILSAVALVLGSLPFVAVAAELKPLEAGTFVLGTHTVSVYYTVNGDTYEVATTIAPGPDAAGAPIRFVGFLQPGQKSLVSVGSFGTTRVPETLELTHQGNLLSATTQVTTLAATH
jgi:hypothetical protein